MVMWGHTPLGPPSAGSERLGLGLPPIGPGGEGLVSPGRHPSWGVRRTASSGETRGLTNCCCLTWQYQSPKWAQPPTMVLHVFVQL